MLKWTIKKPAPHIFVRLERVVAVHTALSVLHCSAMVSATELSLPTKKRAALSGRDRTRVQELADQLQSMSQELRALSSPAEVGIDGGADLGLIARTIYQHRRRRAMWFPEELLGEPFWDVLLDLFATEYEGRTISVSSACVAAAVPATTALRWLTKMIEAGLLEATPCGHDKRVRYVRLSEATRESMRGYLAAHGSLPPLGDRLGS
jgi:hypothetical protein